MKWAWDVQRETRVPNAACPTEGGKSHRALWTEPWPTHVFANPPVHRMDLGSPGLREGSQRISCLLLHAQPSRHTKPCVTDAPTPASLLVSPQTTGLFIWFFKQYFGTKGSELKDTNWWNILIFCLSQQLTLFCNLSRLSGGEPLSSPLSRWGMSYQVPQLLVHGHTHRFSQKEKADWISELPGWHPDH